MIKRDIHIEIARSSITELSSMSTESCDAILAVLSKHYSSVGVSTVNTVADLQALVALKPDLVFLGMKYVPTNPALGRDDPNKVWLSEYLMRHGVTSTGSTHHAHLLELEKPLAKKRILDSGLATSAFQIVKQGEATNLINPALAFPVFIKPTNRGGGQGIDSYSVANNQVQLTAKVLAIANNHQADSIIENYLDGREFSVAILKDIDSLEYNVMPIELVARIDDNGSRILSSIIKSENGEVVLEVKDQALRAKINDLALDVFKALGSRDYGRIDIRLDNHGQPNFLEANLIPSLINNYGNFPKACLLNIGLEYEPMIIKIVNLGLSRNYGLSESIVNRIAMPLIQLA